MSIRMNRLHKVVPLLCISAAFAFADPVATDQAAPAANVAADQVAPAESAVAVPAESPFA